MLIVPALALLPFAPLQDDAAPALELASLWSSGMVMPADRLTRVWGWGAPGERVVVEPSWCEPTFWGEPGEDGRFSIEIPTPKAGGPFTLSVRQGEQRIELDDLLSGVVWVASGQSNMEWRLTQSENGEDVAAEADHPQLRLFKVPRRISLDPEARIDASWKVCEPSSAEEFSAVGYYFGRELLEDLDVPVGVVQTAWGGTPVESWVPQGDLAAHGGFTMKLIEQDGLRAARGQEFPSLSEQQDAWIAGLDDAEGDNLTRFASFDLDDSGWSSIEQPGPWENAGFGFDGAAWLRVAFHLDGEPAAGEWTLNLGAIDDQDRSFVNGVEVGRNETPGVWNRKRSYRFDAGLLKDGHNAVAIRALDTGGAGGTAGAPEDYHVLSPDGERIELAGTWRYAESVALSALPSYPSEPAGAQYRDPCVLWNGMVEGLEGFGFEGAIWYQGESNVSRPGQYVTLFQAMIESWQRRLGSPERPFPFYFVQIAPFAYGGDRGNAARLREAQAAALDLEHTGMAVTLDVGNPKDIHPTDKRTVGERLARLALARTYGRELADAGPELIGARTVGPEMFLYFDGVGGGLSTHDGEAVQGLFLAGEDRVFHPAEAVVGRDLLVLRSGEVAQPVAARYCFDSASEGNLVGVDGLPAAPFRTDDWPMRPTSMEAELAELGTAFEPLFEEGAELGGFEVVNGAPDTWSLEDGVLATNGKPTSLLRSPERYRNFVLELEYRHLNKGGNAGLFVWSDPLPAPGVPFARAVEVQVLDGIEGDWFSSDGDIFPIHGARMEPLNGRGGSRAFPTRPRANPAPMWNHYRVRCEDGFIQLWVNGELVTQGREASPSEGFVMFEAEGAPAEFRNARIARLPESGDLSDGDRADELEDWRSLYSGRASFMEDSDDLVGRQLRSWTARDWVLAAERRAPDLRLRPEVAGLRLDYRRVEEPGEDGLPVELGDQWLPIARSAERPVGQWNRFEARAENGELSVWLNGELALVTACDGPLEGLRINPRRGALEIANLFVLDGLED
ncbi:MAG: family 16 glycoside hydrolase [Planctomycetota bacterium]|jgi:sialate O-acetylesterase